MPCSSDSEWTSDEDDFSSLPVINVTSLNPRGGIDVISTSAANVTGLDAESGENGLKNCHFKHG